MSEGVEILISADDQASKVLAKVGDNVESKVKQIKEVSRGAKASTEFVGTLANSLGGSVIGSYASGIAQLTERIGNFSEVSKAGAGGALAFKAGLAGVALVAGFKIGTMIGDWAFETERWKKEIEKANEALIKAASLAEHRGDVGFQTKVATIEDNTESDPTERVKQLKALHNQITDEAEKTARQLEAQTKELEEQQTWYQKNIHLSDEQKAADAAELSGLKTKLDMLEKQREILQDKTRKDVLELESLKEANALKKRNDSYIAGLQEEVALLAASKDQQAEIKALQKAGGDKQAADKIELLLREKDVLEEKARAEKQLDDDEKKRKEDKLRDAERIADLGQKELDKLEEQRIAMDKGKEAAHAFALEKEGLDKALAARIAKEQFEIDEKKDATKATEDFRKPDIQAVQSRLLTRGPMEKGIDKVAKNTEGALVELKAIREKLPLSTSRSEMEFVS